MLREVVIGARFGTGATYDAYIAAFRIPDLMFYIVMSGAFGSAFIPVFSGFIARDEQDRAWKLANTLLTYTLIILAAVALLILVFAEPLIGTLVAPDLPPASQELAVNLTRLLLLSPLLLGLSAAAKSMLEAHNAFILTAVGPNLYNVCIISSAFLLVPSIGVYGLAIGVIAGAAALLLLQTGALLLRGFRFRPGLSRDTEGLMEVARLLGPRVTGQVINQLHLVVVTNFASRLGEGRISALYYAQHLVMLPHGVLAMSVSTVIFPLMARQFTLGKLADIQQTTQRAIGMLLFLTIPATVGLIAFRVSIVEMVFQYGSFTARSTALVSEAVTYFALGLVARSINELIARVFYAMRDTRTPITVAIITTVANIGFSWPLASQLGHGGLALGLSITYTARVVILMMFLSRRLDGLNRAVIGQLRTMLPAIAIMTVASFAMAEPLQRVTDPATGRSIWDYGFFVATLAVAGSTYVVAAHFLRIPELIQLRQMVLRRLNRLS